MTAEKIETETELVSVLLLNEITQKFPCPKPNETVEDVVDLSKSTYSAKALTYALNNADDQTLKKCLDFEKEFLVWNNITWGMINMGCNITVKEFIKRFSDDPSLIRRANELYSFER